MTEPQKIVLVFSYPAGGRRHWLTPKWFTPPGKDVAMGGPWPIGMEWCPDPDPARICVRCGADENYEGAGYVDHEGFREGFHCIPCHDLLHPHFPPPALPQPLQFLRRRLRRMQDELRWQVDLAYRDWCERFGKRIQQEEPERPGVIA